MRRRQKREEMRKDNPALYREMSVPFEDDTAANAALKAFFEDIEASRKKHKISDVAVLVEIGTMTDGEETRGCAQLYLGNGANTLPMLARAYGEARGVYEEQLGLLMARSRKRGRGE